MKKIMKNLLMMALAVFVGKAFAAETIEPVATWTNFNNDPEGYTLTKAEGCKVNDDGSITLGDAGLSYAFKSGDGMCEEKVTTVVMDVTLPEGSGTFLTLGLGTNKIQVNSTGSKLTTSYDKGDGRQSGECAVGRTTITVTYSGSNGTHVYKDGVSIITDGALRWGGQNLAKLTIGACDDGTIPLTGAILHSMRIYAAKLTADEVAQEMVRHGLVKAVFDGSKLSAGELTLDSDNAENKILTVNEGATLNLLGSWGGDVKVYGTIKGTGTISGTLMVYAAELDASNGALKAGQVWLMDSANGVTVNLPENAAAGTVVVYCNNKEPADLIRDLENKCEGFKFVSVDENGYKAIKIAAAQIGTTKYATLAAAVAEATVDQPITLISDVKLTETLTIPATKDGLTINLNGKTISGVEGAKLSNLGTLTITDSSSEMTGMFEVKFLNAGTANLKGGVFALGVENTGTIEVTGGAYLGSAFDRAWVKAGYACCDVGDDETAIIAVAKLPTATVTSISNDELASKNAPKDLTYTLKFKADQVSDFQMLCFTNWYADFEFTISADAKFNCSSANSDGYLAGQYDSWAKNWISVPTTDVELKANESLKVMEFGAGLLKKPGLKMTYGEVATLVKEFSCGVALRPEFVAANPGLTVKLSLKMYNPKNESEFYTIGNEYTFELPAETDNVIIVGSSGAIINCESLQDAIDAVADLEADADGSQIAILKNYEISEDLTVSGTRNLFFNIGENKSITLAEGKNITISGANVAFVGEGSLVGFTADNIELDDKSVLTLPEAAQALAESFEAQGKYVTQNDDETWSVANELTLQIQVVDGEPSVGFLKDTRRDYTIEGSADLKIWGDVEAEDDNLTQGADIALPLKWHKPASGYFFRVKAEKKSN